MFFVFVFVFVFLLSWMDGGMMIFDASMMTRFFHDGRVCFCLGRMHCAEA